jgi:predicted  nucleic acid-binding Zn-ribbon protein
MAELRKVIADNRKKMNQQEREGGLDTLNQKVSSLKKKAKEIKQNLDLLDGENVDVVITRKQAKPTESEPEEP